MNYENILNLLKGYNYTSTYGNTYGYPDTVGQKYADDYIRSIWYSDGRNEIEVKEEKKNGKTKSEVCSSSQHPDDGCIYW